MKKYKVFINGEFIDAESQEIIEVTNPANGEIVSQVPSSSRDDVEKAIRSAVSAQSKWRRMPQIDRALYLKKIAIRLREQSDYFGKIICEEQGKPLSHAIGEVLGAADLFEYHAEWARRIEGELIPSDSPNENIFLYKEPLGVVTCILPWNFPMYVLARKMAPALITGNVTILKPSSETPNSALEFAKILQDIDLPAGVTNVITGRGSIIGNTLTTDPRINMVTVTGSTESGKDIMRSCAENITKVSLELGGKAPAIVMDDADIELATRSIIDSRISNAGQVCNCTERVYVHENIYDSVVERIVELMKNITFGDGMRDKNVQMGPLINHSAVKSVHDMVIKAIKDGAELLLGGYIPEQYSKGSFYPPTVLVNCQQSMEIMHKEIFGPVLPVMKFKTLDEAISLANDCEYGLTSTIYTKDLNRALFAANNMESGEVYINRKQSEAYNGYHAGWKKSGLGGDDGKHGMEEFLQTRIVYIKY
ncbi:aldehyde dehydrogenase [Tepidanaerobacter sp. EBM-49]|uniref:aldehyde dehydrogenase n=1 Tax=Tepidanaerobacter sp. EBM-49 TaxID=1918504 RepID=UPI000A78F3FB|nr:aldehyde dehydrogenase [Tepidanaerobacter sp. EBM-49]